ncbi:MAG TPA: tetratricopeptide repeat-containing protein [Pyrinomonadaceae bacterium]|nr:tetratricopeptide repeat-containing protein [Pyrinomonadaceae bacterium]
MPESTAPEEKRTCYVVMGFGKKTDFETGRTLDLDKSYRHIIKPAVEAAGMKCVRADEIVHSGVIDVPMYEHLLTAEVVIADLSASNRNAFYELGVRHALRPYTTIVICEDSVRHFPFDVNAVNVLKYHHMGEGLDFEEVERFRKVLTEAITKNLGEKQPQTDSPVYTFLSGLTPPELAGVAWEAAQTGPVAAGEARPEGLPAFGELMRQADEAQSAGDFVTAKTLISSARWMMKEAADPNRAEDPYVIQRLALATYKSKQPTPQAALEEARALLVTLSPATSNDTETLGLWGAVHKRLWELTGDRTQLDEAVRSYERGFYLRNDYYNGINLAYLLDVRSADACKRADAAATADAARAERAEAVSCFVQAVRVRREVVSICGQVLAEEGLTGERKYWALATMAEAYLGVGDEAAAQQKLREAFALTTAQWMKDSTQQQMDKLRELLAKSPLKYIKSDA